MENSAKPATKTARISFDDETFTKMMEGQEMTFELTPGTTHVLVRLSELSKYRQTFVQILNEARRAGQLHFPQS